MREIIEEDIDGINLVVRADLNLNYDKKNGLRKGKRMERHANTLKILRDMGANITMLSHQGRKGRDDFISLKNHAEMLKEESEVDVGFLEFEEIERYEPEEKGAYLVENVRFYEGETTVPYDCDLVKKLSKKNHLFVLDALSVAHRNHASVVGFSRFMRCYAGPVLAEELRSIEKLKDAENVLFVLGGGKIEDSIDIMERWFYGNRNGKVLSGGLVGVYLKKMAENGGVEGADERTMEKARHLLKKHREHIMIPKDFKKGEDGEPKDIGEETISNFCDEISSGEHDAVFVNGPMGTYEREEFREGTIRVFKEVSKSNMFSVFGGGHTIEALEIAGIKEKDVGYISTSGKALMKYLAGKELPGIKALD